jgi:hypothetical protein
MFNESDRSSTPNSGETDPNYDQKTGEGGRRKIEDLK